MSRNKMMAPPPPPKRKNLFKDNKEDWLSPSRSLVYKFDDLMRKNKVLLEPSEDKFLAFLDGPDAMVKILIDGQRENARLNNQLDKAIQESRVLEQKLNQARNLLSEENARARRAEQEKEIISKKFDMVRDLLTNEHGNTLNNETRQKLQRLEASVTSLWGAPRSRVHMSPAGDLSVVNEIDFTESILDVSDLSFDATRDNTLDESKTRSGRNFKRKSAEAAKRRSKRSRGSGGQILEGRVEPQGGRISDVVQKTRKSMEEIAARRSMRRSLQTCAEVNIDDYIPSAPPCENNAEVCWQNTHNISPQKHQREEAIYTPKTPSVQRSHSNAGMNSRRHMFELKKVFKFELCGPCGKKLTWGKAAYKCFDCRAVAHAECKDKVPLPCIGPGSVKTTPGKTVHLALADYTPLQAPMVPALVVHCVNEIEKRGLSELGLYRVPGSEREVKDLKERFLKGKGCPNLDKVEDIHVLCGCLKDFLRNLKESLIPLSMWTEFTQASAIPDQTDAMSSLSQAISRLPQPNRDTLAYLMLHFKRVAECEENKMTVSNLAKILAPTIVGYSTPNIEPANIVSELKLITTCLEKLLEIDTDYWNGYVEVEGENLYPTRLNILSPGTPEYLGIFRPVGRDLFTPRRIRNRSMTRHEQFFKSPMLH